MVTMTSFITLLCLLLLSTVLPSSAKQVQKGKIEVREECPCELAPRPDKAEKALTARWMVHSLDWGILATISTRLGGDASPVPFGNVYSFVDGTCEKSTGTPYFYGTYMDQSYTDSLSYETVSLSLSEASLSSVCTEREAFTACTLGSQYGDPENPVCARLTLTGKFVALTEGTEEYEFAKEAIFERHPSMEAWPDNHEWMIAKIDIEDVWLIDFFGGASILTPDEYFAAMGDGR